MVGVALEGGGARGAYHAGAIKALRDKKIPISIYVGTSIGAINAAIASYKSIDELIDMWKNANSETILGLDDEVLQEISNKNITKELIKKVAEDSKKIIVEKGIDTKKIKSFLNDIIDEEDLRNSKTNFGLVTFNLTDSKPIKIFKNEIPKGKLIEYLIASSYLPVFKSYKIIDDKYYMDGGIYDNLPVDMLLESNCDKIYAIRTNSIGRIKKVKSDNVIYIKPRKKLGSMLVFDPNTAEKNINLGYFDTLKVIDNLDGYDYYIKPKSERFYRKAFSSLSFRELTKLKLDYKTVSYKIIALKLIEEVSKELNINNFKVYSFNSLLIKAKIKLSKANKRYIIIKKLKINIF